MPKGEIDQCADRGTECRPLEDGSRRFVGAGEQPERVTCCHEKPLAEPQVAETALISSDASCEQDNSQRAFPYGREKSGFGMRKHGAPRASGKNLRMLARRRASGLSQKELAVLAKVRIVDVQAMERFACVSGRLPSINVKLQRVAHVLEADFDELFPDEYLKALEGWRLHGWSEPYHWLREMNFSSLPARQIKSIPADDPVEQVSLQMNHASLLEVINQLLGELRPGQRLVVEKRFGLDGEGVMTQEQVGCILGVTAGRIGQIEHTALCMLRHPVRANKLRGFL